MAAAAWLPLRALPPALPPPQSASASAASTNPATVMLLRLMISPSLLTEVVRASDADGLGVAAVERIAFWDGLRSILSVLPYVHLSVQLFPRADRVDDASLVAGFALGDEQAAVAFVR